MKTFLNGTDISFFSFFFFFSFEFKIWVNCKLHPYNLGVFGKSKYPKNLEGKIQILKR